LAKIKLREDLESRDGCLWVDGGLPGRQKASHLLFLSIDRFEGLRLAEKFSTAFYPFYRFLSLPKWNIKLREGKGVQQFSVKRC